MVVNNRLPPLCQGVCRFQANILLLILNAITIKIKNIIRPIFRLWTNINKLFVYKKTAIVSVYQRSGNRQSLNRTCYTWWMQGLDVKLVGRFKSPRSDCGLFSYKTYDLAFYKSQPLPFFNLRLFFVLLFTKADLFIRIWTPASKLPGSATKKKYHWFTIAMSCFVKCLNYRLHQSKKIWQNLWKSSGAWTQTLHHE